MQLTHDWCIKDWKVQTAAAAAIRNRDRQTDRSEVEQRGASDSCHDDRQAGRVSWRAQQQFKVPASQPWPSDLNNCCGWSTHTHAWSLSPRCFNRALFDLMQHSTHASRRSSAAASHIRACTFSLSVCLRSRLTTAVRLARVLIKTINPLSTGLRRTNGLYRTPNHNSNPFLR